MDRQGAIESSRSGGGSGLSHDDSMGGRPSPVGASLKVCCSCGKDVAGQKRFKDALGRYWCFECGEADSIKKHPVPCPDCGKSVIKTEMEEYEGTQLCTACADKRRAAARREAARKKFAEEEARRSRARWRAMMIAACIFAVLAIAVALVRVL